MDWSSSVHNISSLTETVKNLMYASRSKPAYVSISDGFILNFARSEPVVDGLV